MENKNLCAYTGNEIQSRWGYAKSPFHFPHEFTIKEVCEREDGGLILCFNGLNNENLEFTLESEKVLEGELVSKGGNVRRQFLDDMGVWDIFNNVWDTDYGCLIGEKLEAFVGKHKNGRKYIAAVSPIFRQIDTPENKREILDGMYKIFLNQTEIMTNYGNEIKERILDSFEFDDLLTVRENLQDRVRKALMMSRDFCEYTKKRDCKLYESYLESVRPVFKAINLRIEDYLAKQKDITSKQKDCFEDNFKEDFDSEEFLGDDFN